MIKTTKVKKCNPENKEMEVAEKKTIYRIILKNYVEFLKNCVDYVEKSTT